MKTIQIDATKMSLAKAQSKVISYSAESADFNALLAAISPIYEDAFGTSCAGLSQAKSFLAVVNSSGSAAVHLNDVGAVTKVKVKSSKAQVDEGADVFVDDIGDIVGGYLVDSNQQEIVIPADCGVTLVAMMHGDKALYCDFEPLSATPRTDDLSMILGQILSHLWFPEQYSMTPAQLDQLTKWGWFPFIGLSRQDRMELIAKTSFTTKPTAFLEDISRRFMGGIDTRLAGWDRYDSLKYRKGHVLKAKEHWRAQDYLSAINLIYPQIEGVMRGEYIKKTASGTPGQGTMARNVVATREADSALLPESFRRYLMEVYFKPFDERAGIIPLSRHTVSHGLANPADYDLVSSAVGFMILDQLFHYLDL